MDRYNPRPPEHWPMDRPSPDNGWRPPTGQVVISADDHVIEPPHLWQDRMPEKYRDSAPKMWYDDTGYHLEIDGRSFDTPGLNSHLVEGRAGMSDQAERMKDMDMEGVDIGFVFPQKALGIFAMEDKTKMVAAYDVYNEWLADWCTYDSDRLFGIGVLPTIFEPEATADYIQKLKDWGFKAMEIPSYPREVRYNSSKMEPMWQAIEESGIALSFHIGENLITGGAGALGTFLLSQFQSFRKLYGLLTFSGLFDRHPELKVIFTEGGIGWASTATFDADRLYREFESEMRPQLAHLPSYYWWQNCYSTFMDGPTGIREIDYIGADHVMWTFDYPHPESTLGESRRILKGIYDALPEDQANMIAGGTAAKVWKIADVATRVAAKREAQEGAAVAGGD
ncbi:MAG TPA: amidohydrolase family protein [Dehalococcoidia bacterium]|nr:amidohydrolase family protein [Dehalococcoidia bacterium]